MPAGDSFQLATGETRSVRQALRFLARAALLRCPVCGTRPIFLRLRRVRSIDDWFRPLDGCPRCGYPYEREPGYFLLAIFGFNFGFAVCVGIGAFVALAEFSDMTTLATWKLIAVTVVPIPLVNLLIARHAKALFIALDHFCDPHVRDDHEGGDDDDDGIHLLPNAPVGSSGGLDPGGDDGGYVFPGHEDEEAGGVVVGRDVAATHAKV